MVNSQKSYHSMKPKEKVFKVAVLLTYVTVSGAVKQKVMLVFS